MYDSFLSDPFNAVLNFHSRELALKTADEMEEEWKGLNGDLEAILEELTLELKFGIVKPSVKERLNAQTEQYRNEKKERVMRELTNRVAEKQLLRNRREGCLRVVPAANIPALHATNPTEAAIHSFLYS